MPGRKRTPVEVLKLTGNYREDRHGDRAETYVANTAPKRPRGLGDQAKVAWRHLTRTTPAGVYGEQDAENMRIYCELWQMYCNARDDGDWEKQLKLVDRWLKVAGRLGVGPVERARLQLAARPEPKDDFDEFLKKAN